MLERQQKASSIFAGAAKGSIDANAFQPFDYRLIHTHWSRPFIRNVRVHCDCVPPALARRRGLSYIRIRKLQL